LRIIPVIDILDSVAVHAVRGMRENYQPLKSMLCASVDPVDVATSLKAFGFSELYVADLDAIRGGPLNSSLLKRIVNEAELKLMVDAGVSNLERGREVLDCGASKVIIGTETLPNISFVAQAIEALGFERVLVSLDLMGDKVLSGFNLGKFAEPMTFLHELETLGVSQIIVLDLSKVGSREGTNLAVLQKVLSHIKIDVLVGGGVRDITDLIELKNLGVSAVLVATALHSGKISPEKLKQAGLF
jgi:phosphoribosylformimino-5-aminoimidazole carboxamide ribotide isomerase